MTVNKPEKEKTAIRAIRDWLHSQKSICALMIFGAFLIVIAVFFCVCTPKKYDLRVGSISHETIDATKDIVDEVTTEEKRNAAAETVEPTYHFQQGVKEEVLSSLGSAFQELRTIQQYGLTLRPDEEQTGRASRPFSEEEIDYAYSLTDMLDLSRTQLTTLMRIDTNAFEEMVSTVTVAVENSLNTTIREGQVSQSIMTIQQIVGYKLDVSLTQNIIPTVLRTCIKPNMIIDEETTEEARQKAREAVEPVIYLQGQNIIREGDRITNSQLEMLRGLGLLNDDHYDYSVYGGALILTVLAMISLLMMLRLLMKDVLSDIRKLAVILIILVLCFGFASLSTLLPSLYIIPIALGMIMGTVLIGYRAGLVMTVPLALLFAGITSVASSTTFYDVVLIMANTLSCGVTTVWFLKGRPQRVRVLVAGLISAVFSLIMIVGVKLLTSAETLDMIHTGIWSLVGSVLSGVLAVALQPVFEALFHLATPSRLLEITNPNQPLMKRLMLEAPGTYHHSIIVANLAESAADKIGANAYLARAGAYYHDIGKLKRPGYFSENVRGGNPHENTDPYVSAAILTAHTRDGALIAQKEHLPPEVQDIILQHHGVTPVMFFYHKALQMADGNHVDINDFRYTGPKPQTREASIVMLADTIEAAVRSMKDPTPKGIDQFIERLIRGKLEDGQLSDCQLSLRDIDQICSSFSGILKGVYHERIEYPKVQQFEVRNETKPAAQSDAETGKDDQPATPEKPDAQPAKPAEELPQESVPGEKNTEDSSAKGDSVNAD
ncbi:MAG: HDIG domain-containing protein [Clostridia bacterium]|nr:HDIG domain-containing protein [Clostridia bacterium]